MWVVKDDNWFLFVVNLIFQVGDDVVICGLVVKVIVWVCYGDFVGLFLFDDIMCLGSGGNFDLKFYVVINFGLLIEWYFVKGSLLLVEVFYCDIFNYVGNVVDNGFDGIGVFFINMVMGWMFNYVIMCLVNGGKVMVMGFLLLGNVNLIWGFGIQGNYIFVDVDIGFVMGLFFLLCNIVMFLFYYENGLIQVCVSYNCWLKYFYCFGCQQLQDYIDVYCQFDVQIFYVIIDGILVMVVVSNLFDEIYYQYSLLLDNLMLIYKNGWVFLLSVSFKM